MDILNEDLVKLLDAFEKFEVKYLIVGGFATNYYGYNRVTGDIDFWIKDSNENRKNIIEAFDYLGYGYFEELLSIPLIPGFCDVYISDGMYADLMNEILGYDSIDFDACYLNARKVLINGVNVLFLDYKDLLHSKGSSNRLKDKLDFEELSKIEEEE